jgi:DNA topoisomerase-3
MGQTASDVLKACFQTFPFLSQAETASPPTEISASAIPSVQGAESPNIGRLLDSRKVSDHHAIIPTIMIEKTDLSTLDKDQKKILTLIASRLVCATGQNHVYETVKATLLCCGYPFAAMGRIVKEEGWKAAETAMLTQCRAFSDEGKEEKESASSGQDLSTLYQGAQFPYAKSKVTEHWTQPLNQYTEDTLLHAMEKAGASDMEADVERKGLGTPATRAGIIDKLVSSKYVSRNKRQLIATEAGRQLIEILPAYLTSPKMTADWENQLLMMERGEQDRQSFMGGITQLISQMLQECRQISDDDKQRFSASGETIQGNHTRGGVGKCPVCRSPVYEGDKTFYCSNRDCSFVLWKHNHYLDRLRTALNSTMVQDLLEKGRTTVKNLYSVKKDSYFTADLLMEWKDNKAAYSLEFPKH